MLNLQELAKRLHEENQFVKSEQDLIWKLKEQVQQHVSDLSRSFWITRQHYLNLNSLILNQSQAICSHRANQLESVHFVDAYKELGYQESMYGQFIESFVQNPTLAAACLAYGDKLGLAATTDVARTIVLSCYGNNIINENYKQLLELMETLMLLQLANEEQPRRLLQKGSSAFCVVFRLFVEALTAGKLFLTSALHQPVMEVLMEDELFLETNANKILNRLTSHEIEKRFGQQDDPGFKDKLTAHVQKTEEILIKKCSGFVKSLLSAMCCFPKSLGWIITRAYHIVKDSGLVSADEARALCTDFLLQHFVCPTIVNPELYGVTGNVPVSEITRFNLIQIAQVLQVMAHRDESPSASSFHSRLERDLMQNLIDAVIDTNCDDVLSASDTSGQPFSGSVFFTVTQLKQLIQFLRDIQQSDVRGVDQSSLAEILSHLPSQPPPCMAKDSPQSVSNTPNDEGVQQSKTALGRLSSSGNSAGDLTQLSGNLLSTPSRKKTAKMAKAKMKSPKKEESPALEANQENNAAGDNTPQIGQEGPETVMIISLPSQADNHQNLPGTLSENEVMEQKKSQERGSTKNRDAGQLGDNEAERLEKRSRLSLYSSASDLSDAGEGLQNEDGISRTSGSSSIDMERTESVPPDDASSIHAVSSHGNQDEYEEGDQESVTHVNNDEALKALRRKLPTSRESIEDKMRKFEIRQELGVRFADPSVPGPRREDSAQAISTDAKSETWSMDAYASDSEPTTEQESQAERLGEIAEDPAEHLRSTSVSVALLGLTREEDSRSDVWSVEVLPSDSEPPDVQSDVRLQELESESGTTATEDALEDNRSRASTPSLSAASGFSGVSGLSLVSDLHQAKAGEEQWSGYNKGPNSISPDAEDLLNRETGSRESSHGGGSSNSSEMNERSRPHSSSPRFQENAAQSPVPMLTRGKSDASDSGRSKKEAPKSGDATEKSVAWKLPKPDAPESANDNKSPRSSHHPVMDFDGNINTIKRSPFKKQNKEAAKPAPGSSSQPVYAWDEKIPDKAPTKSNGLPSDPGPSTMVNHDPSSAFLPVKSATEAKQEDVLKDFDPLATNLPKPVVPTLHHKDASLNDTMAKASTLPASISPTSPPAYAQESSSPRGFRQTSHSTSKHRDHPSPTSQDPQESPRMRSGIGRKKSWWRDKGLPNFVKKNKASIKGLLPGSESGNVAAGGFPRVESQESFASNTSLEEPPSPATERNDQEPKSSPGDDIMQKYMKKVSSSQQMASASDNPDASSSDLNDTQNLSGSTATTAQSPLSDDTVTTATRGASSTSSAVPFVNEWGATSGGEGQRNGPSKQEPDTYKKSPSELRKDARRKLRIVLAATRPTSHILMTSLGDLTLKRSVDFLLENDQFNQDETRTREELLSFLRVHHAEALMLQDQSRMAQIHEVKRCVEAMDNSSCRKIIKSLWRAYRGRSHYHLYLTRSRQHLLSVLSHLNHVAMCMDRDRALCTRYFTAQCVRFFLKRRESSIAHFRSKFVRSSAMDDKVTLVDLLLERLGSEMVEDPMWEGASEEQLAEARSCIERSIFTHIYKHVLFPNGDADILRDELYHQHICRLSAVLTPSHPSLQVSSKYMLECPWPSAQQEASAIAAHRSPRGKLDAALRCCRAIMHLLKLADENEAPGADDFTPVLVFVLVKANPQQLLSTVQFVNSFLGSRLSGENAYWWMQFTAATEFIKTIDERK